MKLSVNPSSVHTGKCPMWPLSMMHWTSLWRVHSCPTSLPSGHCTSHYRDTLHPQLQSLSAPSGRETSSYRDLPPSSDIWWPWLDTCSNLVTWWSPPTSADICTCDSEVGSTHLTGIQCDQYIRMEIPSTLESFIRNMNTCIWTQQYYSVCA